MFTTTTLNPLRQLYNSLINSIFPPGCMACDQIISETGCLCVQCWQMIDFNCEPACAICSYPFEYDAGEGMLCPECARKRPLYNKAYTVFRYNKVSKVIIHKLKYYDNTYLSPYLAKWLYRAGHQAIIDADLMVPVPLHKYKLLSRLYNQSALLAKDLSMMSKVAYEPRVLERIKNTVAQTTLTYKDRHHNVKNVFKVNRDFARKISGKKILLIDDVITTGATVDSCTEALLKGGCRQVKVLALARVII